MYGEEVGRVKQEIKDESKIFGDVFNDEDCRNIGVRFYLNRKKIIKKYFLINF